MKNHIIPALCIIPLLAILPLSRGVQVNNDNELLNIPHIESRAEKMIKNVEELNKIEKWLFRIEKLRLMEIEAKNLEKQKEEAEMRMKKEQALKERNINNNNTKNRSTQIKQGRKVTLNVSHYCSCYECTQNTSNVGKTASGAYAQAGVTIAMPSSISFGTRVQIGNNTYTVQDRGGAIVNNGKEIHVDVYVSSHSEALRLGRYVTDGYILN